MKFIFFFFYIIFTLFSSLARSQGLGFHSTEQRSIANRTSYTVFAKNIPKLHGELSISFKLSILDPTSFGFIFIVGQDDSNDMYSLAYENWDDEISHLKLNLKGEKNLLTIPVSLSQLGKGKWLNIKLHFIDTGISFTVNDELHQTKVEKISELMFAQIFFGKHENIIDVPSFAIRDLIVNDDKQEFHFTFKENAGNIISDQNGNPLGNVENPIWLINNAYHWKHHFTYTSDEIVAVNFDNNKNRILVAGKDSIAFFDLATNAMEKKAYTNSLPVPMRLGMSFIAGEKLFIYEVNDVIEGYPSIASIDMNKLSWEVNSYLTLDQQRHHHNAYFDSENQLFYIFGGFGNKRMNNTFDCYNIANNSWSSLSFSGELITPRFFSGMGQFNEQLILFGGVGNETGDQSIGKKYYYDCYKIDIKNRHIKKLWEIDRADTNLVSTRNIIISSDSASFYTLCYPEYIPQTYVKLHQYNIETGAFTVLGDSIPITSERIRTNANLYLNERTKEMFCIIQEILDENASEISVYSIDNKPVTAEELLVELKNIKNRKIQIYWTVILTLFIVGLVAFWFLYKRKIRLEKNKSLSNETGPSTIFEQKIRPQKNSLYIFGIFAAFDRWGTDITHLFSPQVKQLFLFILLKSNEKDTGVTSEHIYNYVWPDKPVKNAKNLKGVTFNKLRKILADIDGIELLHENQCFKIQTSPPAYCDYLEYKSVYNDISIKINDLNIERIVEITSRGQFLKSVNNDYFDTFKKDVSDQILGIVPLILKQNFEHKNYAKTISIASVLYFADELNECALYYILKSYLGLGNKVAAKKHYIDYIIRYKKIQGEDYSFPYKEAIIQADRFIS